MPQQEIIEKASLLGGTISVWLKVTGVVISIIGYGFLTYYQIQSNTTAQHEFELLMQKEMEVLIKRGDTRYNRAMQKAEELKKENAKTEQEVEDLKEELAFIKGRMYEQDKSK